MLVFVFRWFFFFFFKQKTAYEMRISDWSSDVCSSDLAIACRRHVCDGRPFDGLRMSGERLFHAIALGYASPMTATPSSRCDIAIVGGGLAGGLAALAFAAKRPDLDVRLIEAGAVGEIGRASCRGRVWPYV